VSNTNTCYIQGQGMYILFMLHTFILIPENVEHEQDMSDVI